MIIEKVTRSYSRSINLKSYGSTTESWVKSEATYTAVCESADDPIQVSSVLAEQAQKDVADQISGIINKVKGGNPNTVPAGMAPAVPEANAAAATPRSL